MRSVLLTFLMCAMATGCRQKASEPTRPQLGSSGWIEEAAVSRGYIKPGDVAQFGCPPGWRAVEDTVAAVRDKKASAVYLGEEPPSYEGTVTCVAQAEFALPGKPRTDHAQQPRQPLAPVWLDVNTEATTIGFRSELPLGAPIYFARDTPCGPRVIGVRLGDLLNWLSDPETAPKRDFLGMTNGGCPEAANK